MIDRVEERFDHKPGRLIGDTAYGTASMLTWMIEHKNSSLKCRFGTRRSVISNASLLWTAVG